MELLEDTINAMVPFVLEWRRIGQKRGGLICMGRRKEEAGGCTPVGCYFWVRMRRKKKNCEEVAPQSAIMLLKAETVWTAGEEVWEFIGWMLESCGYPEDDRSGRWRKLLCTGIPFRTWTEGLSTLRSCLFIFQMRRRSIPEIEWSTWCFMLSAPSMSVSGTP